MVTHNADRQLQLWNLVHLGDGKMDAVLEPRQHLNNMLPDAHTQHTTQNFASCSNHLTCRIGDARKKMRPDMMIVEMTDTEQHTYLPHDIDTGSRLPNLQRTMPNGKARKITIVEGGYCSDVSYLEKVKEKGQQHARLEQALRLYGYDVTSLTYICGCTGSQYHSSNDTIRMLGIEYSVAKNFFCIYRRVWAVKKLQACGSTYFSSSVWHCKELQGRDLCVTAPALIHIR